MTDSGWLVRVESDNARISSRISASRSGGLGGVLIYVADADEMKFCLLLRFFSAETGNPILSGGLLPIPQALDACATEGKP